MGIHGIYKEIGPGRRIALSRLALDTFEKTGRPLRIAIDTSIWLFQIQASKGGTNPALRTFYYRLLRLIALDIHPVFVFDGPNKPPFKRNKRTGPTVASIPEFLAKQLLKQFGFPIHKRQAPPQPTSASTTPSRPSKAPRHSIVMA
jgi:Holliday junction resolvase YEN1